jgi:hyperosmotically inducible protein
MRRIAAISLGLAATLAIACSKERTETQAVHSGAAPRQGNAPPRAGAVLPAPAVNDELITAAVHRRLEASDAVPAQRIEVETDTGAVTLSGFVPHLRAKDAAVKVARATRGAIAVVDRIQVPPSPRSDAEIKAAVEASLRDAVALQSTEFEVEAHDGHVKLEGEVDSYPEQRAAAVAAKATVGVRSVDNQIQVRLAEKRADSEILADVRRSFDFDARLDGDRIEVDVANGTVDLGGNVPSDAQRYRAWQKAWVAGVKQVDDSDLEVVPLLGDRMRKSADATPPADAKIETALKTAFDGDPRIRPAVPGVTVDDGIVTLRGVVTSLGAKRAAADTAWNSVGVADVRNYLKVEPLTIYADIDLAKRVEAALDRDPYLNGYDIEVTANRGKVKLFGEVNSRFDRNEAERVVSHLTGPIEITNLLAVPPTQPQRDLRRMDWELRQEIHECLFWDADVDQRLVNVAVDGGVVRLSGRVRSPAARDAARACAQAVFPLDLEDHLTIWPPARLEPEDGRRHARL